MRTRPAVRLAAVFFPLLLVACGGGGGSISLPDNNTGGDPPPAPGPSDPSEPSEPADPGDPVEPANRPPVITVEFPGQVTEFDRVTLAASGEDADGDALAFSWTYTAGPLVEFADPALPTLTFTAPATDLTVTLMLRLEVTDGHNDPVVQDISIDIVPGLKGIALFMEAPLDEPLEAPPTDDHDIYLQPHDAGHPEKIAAYDPGTNPGFPLPSPDGSRLAYVNGGNLAILDLATRQTLAIDIESVIPRLFNWSPDGTRIAIADQQVHVATLPESLDAFDPVKDIIKVSGETTGNSEALAWSPDGKRIAASGTFCDSRIPGITQVIVLPASQASTESACDTEGAAYRVSPISDDCTANPAGIFVAGSGSALRFSPDGKWLAFPFSITHCSAVSESHNGFAIANASGSPLIAGRNWRMVTGENFVFEAEEDTDANINHADVAWSPDGTQLAFSVLPPMDFHSSTDCRDCGIYTVSITDEVLQDPDADFTALRVKRSADVGLYTKSVTNITLQSRMAWAPDGSRLAFSGGLSEGGHFDELGLFIVDAAPEDNTPLRISGSAESLGDADGNGKLDDGGVADFAWSPDGRYLAMNAALRDESHDGSSYVNELWQIDVAAAAVAEDPDTTRRRLSGDVVRFGRVMDFAWSGNSRELLFIGDLVTNEHYELFSVPAGDAPGESQRRSSALQDAGHTLHGAYALHPLGAGRILAKPADE